VSDRAAADDGHIRFVFVKRATAKIDRGIAAVHAYEAAMTMPEPARVRLIDSRRKASEQGELDPPVMRGILTMVAIRSTRRRVARLCSLCAGACG
jgi:hypothetical protein